MNTSHELTGRARAASAFARQFAPGPAAVTPPAAIAQTFATARTPQARGHLWLLNGPKGCAVAPGIVDRIKSLLAARTINALAEARGLIEQLPEDHPAGMKLVREAYDVLLALTDSPTAA